MTNKVATWVFTFIFLIVLFNYDASEIGNGPGSFLSSIKLFDLIAIIVLFFLFYFAGIYIHEFGHALFGAMAGLRVKKIQIGAGNPLVDFTMFGVRFVIAIVPDGGYVAFDAQGKDRVKARLFAMTSGGVSANFLAAAFALFLGGIDPINPPAPEEWAGFIIFMFALSNLFLMTVNLIPLSSSALGFLAFSDGKQLLRIPGYGPGDIADSLATGDILGGFEKILEDDFKGAEKIFLDVTKNYPESVIAKINLGVAYIKQVKIAETRSLLQQIDTDQTPEHYRALVWHNLGWIRLVEGGDEALKLAVEYSDKSLSVLPGLPIFKAQKGAALVESGDTKGGMSLLESINVRALTPYEKDRVVHLAYLAYGYWMQKNMRKVKNLSSQVDEHYEETSPDQKIIIDRLRKKSNDFGRGDSGSNDSLVL